MLASLAESPHSYTLFAALRRIEQAYRDRPRLGESRKATDDAVRVAQQPHLYFAPADVQAFEPDGSRQRLDQFGFGIFGPNGALPIHLTELAYARKRQFDDPTLADFINTFHHRFACLFYRAWAQAEPCVSLDRPETDAFRLYLGALIGIGTEPARDRDSVLDYAKLSRVGLYGSHSRSAEGIAQILAEYFELPVELRQFVGTWMEIPAEAWCRLGVTNGSAILGAGATLGRATYQSQSRFEIVLGPIELHDFVNFLPGARGLDQLKALVRLYTNEEWSWQLKLLLKSEQLPAVRLGQSGWLGWTTWFSGGEPNASRSAVIQGSAPEALN